jgi:glycosyltransferase involved in cell wall biosynthesis
MKYPEVSIIIITYNEEKNIGECIDSILAQDYKGKFEVIVADGESKDRTREIIKEYQKNYKIIRLFIDDKKGFQNTSRNLGIIKSKYELVAFIDADCHAPKNWLTILVKKYEQKKAIDATVAGVGGANIPYQKHDSRFNDAVAIAFDSFLGSLGSIQAMPLKKDAEVFSVSCTNVLYNKHTLQEVGLFPVFKKKMGDDWILGARLKEKNYKLIGLKDSYVLHKFRPTPKRFWENMVLYGSVRTNFIKMYPKFNGIIYYLPIIFIFTMISTVFSFYNKIFFIPLLYFPIILLYSLILCIRKKKLRKLFDVFFVFILQHFGYSIGMILGVKWFFYKSKHG